MYVVAKYLYTLSVLSLGRMVCMYGVAGYRICIICLMAEGGLYIRSAWPDIYIICLVAVGGQYLRSGQISA
jgi:hypothetical protein